MSNVSGIGWHVTTITVACAQAFQVSCMLPHEHHPTTVTHRLLKNTNLLQQKNPHKLVK